MNKLFPEDCTNCDLALTTNNPPPAAAGVLVPRVPGSNGQPVVPAPDYSVTESFVCNAETNLYDRVTSYFIDNVLQSETVVATTTACEDDAPVIADEILYSTVELCVNGQIEVQFYSSTNGAAPVASGAPIATGRTCGQGEYVGQVCYEYITPTDFTSAVIPQWRNDPDLAGIPGGGSLGSFTPTVSGAYAVTIGATLIRNPAGATVNPSVAISVAGVLNTNTPFADRLIGPGNNLTRTYNVNLVAGTTYALGGFAGGRTRADNVQMTIAPSAALIPPFTGKRTAYGIRDAGGMTTYYDSDTDAILVDGTYTVCPPVQASIDGLTDTDALVASPDGSNIPNNSTFNFPIDTVRTFTVFKEGGGNITIDFGNGRSVTMDRNGSRTFGSADGAGRIDVSNVTITTGANSNGEVTWENV